MEVAPDNQNQDRSENLGGDNVPPEVEIELIELKKSEVELIDLTKSEGARAPPLATSLQDIADSSVKRRLEIDLNSSKKRKMDHSLEQFFLRFPKLEEKICNQLDQQSLITFTKVSKEMMNIRLGRRFYWVRNIEYQLRGLYKYKIPKSKRDPWRKAIQRSPVEIVKEIFQMTAQFYKFSTKNKNGTVKCSPLHIAAECGNLKICHRGVITTKATKAAALVDF